MRISDWSSDVCSSDLRDGRLVPDRLLRAADIPGGLGETNNPDWTAVAYDALSGELVAPLGSSGFRWGEQGKWNLEEKAGQGRVVRLRSTLAAHHDSIERTSTRLNPRHSCATRMPHSAGQK